MGSGVAGYEILIDGTTLIDVGNNLSHTVSGLGAATTHQFKVRSYDNAGNRSAWSSPVSGTTDAAADLRTPILDSLSGGVVKLGAYSFAKLRAAYGGSAVRVINTTTSVQTDVGFDGNGNFDRTAAAALATAGQVLEIKKYYDQSGQTGNDLLPLNDTTGHRHVLDLTGHRACAITTVTGDLGGYQTAANIQAGGSDATLTNPAMFFVKDFYNNASGHYLLDFGTGASYFQIQQDLGITDSPVTKTISIKNGGSTISSAESINYNGTNGDSIRQLTVLFQSGNDRIRRDGIELTVGANAGDTARTSVPMTLGAYYFGSIAYSGRFHELILLDGTILSGDITAIENDQMPYFQDGKHVITIGDSRTYGNKLTFPDRENYGGQLKTLWLTNGASGWDVESIGRNGATIEQVVSDLVPVLTARIRSTASKYVVIIDGYYNNSGGDTAAVGITKMQTLVDDVRAVLRAGDQIWVRTCTRATGTGVNDSRIIAWNALVNGGGLTGVDHVVDCTADTHIGDAANTSDTTYYDSDQIHPTAAGTVIDAGYGYAVGVSAGLW